MEERLSSEHPEGQQGEMDSVSSFEELYRLIQSIGDVRGSQKVYTPDELITIIERVRHGHRESTFVTSSNGIRAAVERLLPDDTTYKKYTTGSRAPKRT